MVRFDNGDFIHYYCTSALERLFLYPHHAAPAQSLHLLVRYIFALVTYACRQRSAPFKVYHTSDFAPPLYTAD